MAPDTLITIEFACGHTVTIPFRPATAPRVGDELHCYQCGAAEFVTDTHVTRPQPERQA